MLDTLPFVSSLLSGIVAGFLFCFLLARGHSNVFILLAPLVLANLPLATNLINLKMLEGSHQNVSLNFIGWAIGFTIMFLFYSRSYIKQGVPFASILSGNAEKRLNHKLNIGRDLEVLERKKESFQRYKATEEDSIKEKKDQLVDYEKRLYEKRALIENNTSCYLFDAVSNDVELIFTHNINQCSKFHRRVVKTINIISKLTDTHCLATKERLDQEGDSAKKIILVYSDTKAYLSDVARNLNHNLMNIEGSRVFFRVQANDFIYKNIAGYYGKKEEQWPFPISDMPFKGSLIEKSFNNEGRPIIYSLNATDAIAPQGQWQDFLTIAPPKPTLGQYPLLSLSISVEDSQENIDFLKFLCHTRFDRILDYAMNKYFKAISSVDKKIVRTAIVLAQNQNRPRG